MKIKLTSIPVNDPIEAHRFYTDVLGFQSLIFMPEGKLAIVVSAEDPKGTALLLEPNENPVYSTFQSHILDMGLPIIIFGVDDVEAEYQRLLKLGVVFRKKPTTNDWGTEAVFEDGSGNLVQIHQD